MFRSIIAIIVALSVQPAALVIAAQLPFDAEQTIVTGFDGAAGIALGDLNGNGTTDITICARNDGVVRHYSNIGSGTWAFSVVDSGLDSPYTVAVGDIDGDGDGDILIGQLNNVPVSTPPYPPEEAELIWYANPKNGSNTGWTAYGIAYLVYDGTRKVALADVDGDGDLDAVYSSDGTYGASVSWVENDGDPTDGWGSSHTITTAPDAPYGLAMADVDGDGDPDLALADSSRDMVTWYENDGASYWTERTVDAFLNGATDVSFGDLDGDGAVDLVAAGNSSDSVVGYVNSGTGGSWTETIVADTLSGPRAVSTGDMDGDGDMDIVVAAISGGDVVWFDNASGDASSWLQRTLDSAFDGAFDVEVGDVDGDGDLDVFASGFSGDRVSFWRNRHGHRRFDHAQRDDIRTGLGDPRFVETADLNGDGALDVIAALWDGASIMVYLGLDPIADLWWNNTVTSAFALARHVSVADVNGDGHLDVLGAAVGADAVRWWENNGGSIPSWTAHDILTGYNGAHRVMPADFDRDGDIDVAVCAYDEDNWAWVENTNGAGTSWTRRNFSSLDAAFDIAVGDLNFDGSPDLVATGYEADRIKFALNGMPDSMLWGSGDIATGVDGPRGVDLGDMDGDGDLDVVVVIRNDDQILWFENDGTGINWTEHDVSNGTFTNGVEVEVVDLDGDGDLDVLASNQDDDTVRAWLNGGDGSSWTVDDVTTAADNAWGVSAADVDSDGRMDVVVAEGGSADRLSWYRNTGEQARTIWYNDAPDTLASGETNVMVTVGAAHQGRAGHDHPMEPHRVRLEFTDAAGTPLTSSQINALLDRLDFYYDSNGSSFWEPTDTVVATDSYITLSSGVLSWTLPDGLADLEVAPGTTKFFSVVATAHAGVNGVFVVNVSNDPMDFQDTAHDMAMSSETCVPVTTGIVQVGDMLFADGFESGNTSAWD